MASIIRKFDKHLKGCIQHYNTPEEGQRILRAVCLRLVVELLQMFHSPLSSGKVMLYNQTRSPLSKTSDKLFVVIEGYCCLRGQGLFGEFPFFRTGSK